MEKLKQNKGITLIALIITIIILLILAGIAINLTIGENGILTHAKNAKIETRGACVEEKRDLWKTDQEADKYAETSTAQTLEELLNHLESEGLINAEERKVIEQTGQVTIGSRTIVFKKKSAVDYVKIGDYVDYDPTIVDKAGTKVESSKLTYTSPTGTIPTDSSEKITHGNGYKSAEEDGGQTFTAKPLSELKWRVLSVSDDKIELVSEVPVKKDEVSQDNGKFVLQGGIGYLYTEQELNEICKIYGYGYGADRSVGAKYTIGGPKDPEFEEVQMITGTGARSITIEDLNKIVGVTEEDIENLSKHEQGFFEDDVKKVWPTLYSNNTSNPGQSSVRVTGYMYRSYSYNLNNWNLSKTTCDVVTGLGSQYAGTGYWLSSRGEGGNPESISCGVGSMDFQSSASGDVKLYGGHLCTISSKYGRLFQYKDSAKAVRPVVTLKSDSIDLTNILDDSGSVDNAWKLK